MKNQNGLKSALCAVVMAMAITGCNSFEDPNAVDGSSDAADTQDLGNTQDTAAPDAGTDSGQDSQQGTDVSSVDAGNTGTDVATVDAQPDVQQVEVQQEVSSTDTAPKAECANDADCNDNNPCTGDICVVGGKCSHMAIAAKCDDNNPCTDNDVCANGQCNGTAKVCADSNPCTDDFCVNGVCAHGINTVGCDDGNACTSSDKCDATKCVGVAIECDDKNPCTTDTCDTVKGCVNTPVLCEDGDPCTTDSCDKNGWCQFSQKVCDDGKAWTYDYCDSYGWYNNTPGQCVAEQKYNACTKDSDCDDGNPCTINVCNGLEGTCNSVSLNCNDNNSCTVDSCVPAIGCANVASGCNDNNPNTTDSCVPATGACIYTPISVVVIPPISTGNVNVTVSSNAALAFEGHLYFGTQANGAAFDNFGTAPANSTFSVDLPKSQLCSWGLEVAARLETATWPWFGCDPTAPSLSTLIIKINGVVVPGTLTKHAWVCQGGGEGNLAFTKAQLGCP